MRKISFKSEGQTLQGTLIKPNNLKGKVPGVIFVHGMTSSEKGYISIAEKLANHGIIGLTISLRGHGTSEGDFNRLTVNDAIQDGLNAYDFLVRYEHIDAQRIGLCGTSVGATIAASVSAKRRVKSLVLRVPAIYTQEMMAMTFKEIMAEEGDIFKKITNFGEVPAMKAISEFKGDLMVVTSENDSVIPDLIPDKILSCAQKSARKQKFMIKGATHGLSDDAWKTTFADEIEKWFIETL